MDGMPKNRLGSLPAVRLVVIKQPLSQIGPFRRLKTVALDCQPHFSAAC
jgi:hypothetical protein